MNLTIFILLVLGNGGWQAGGRSYADLAARERAHRPRVISVAQTPIRFEDTSPSRTSATGIGAAPRGVSPAQARLMAQRAAEVRAMRNLAMKTQNFDGRSQLSPAGNGVIRFQGRVRGFQLSRPQTLPDGRVEVRAEMVP